LHGWDIISFSDKFSSTPPKITSAATTQNSSGYLADAGCNWICCGFILGGNPTDVGVKGFGANSD
jgi:hypothetical protein